MRLIDADVALDAFMEILDRPNHVEFLYTDEICRVLESLPSVQPPTGKWRHYEGTLTCSECGTEYYDEIMELCGDEVPKFCPNCGARMVKE